MHHLYLYKLEASFNGDHYTYYGSRKSKVEPEKDPYMGSPCTKQGQLVFKSGLAEVRKTILRTNFSSYDELLRAEKELIEQHYNDLNNLNFSKNPFNFVDANRKPKTSIHKQKLAEAKIGPRNHQYGKLRTTEEKAKIAASLKGKTPYNKGLSLGKYSEDRRKKMGEGQRLKPKITCPHCGKIGAMNGMNRYHFDNCRHQGRELESPTDFA